jgi:hypothetical protein
MTFRKNNPYCWQPEGERALDPKPVCFKLDSDLKKKLKAVPDWQKRLRDRLPSLIEEWTKD